MCITLFHKYIFHVQNMNPSIQRHLTDALLRASEVSLVIFKKYSNTRVHSQVKLWQNSSDSEVVSLQHAIVLCGVILRILHIAGQ